MMPEKNTDSWLLLGMLIVAILSSLGNALAEEECLTHTSWKHLILQTFIGGISGMIFGFFACWLIDNQWASFAISGSGAILGIKGVRTISLLLIKKIEKNVKK